MLDLMKFIPMLALAASALPSRQTLFGSMSPGGKTSVFAPVQNTNIKDLSGMSYVGSGSFIAVHDMKFNENATWERLSLVQLPIDLATGLETASVAQAHFENDKINWPERTIDGHTAFAPNDLESVAGIPGKLNWALLCESTNSRKNTPVADRIYLAEVTLGGDINGNGAPDFGTILIKDYTNFSSFTWSYNVEATAVAKTDSGYLFLWGERNETTIRWAPMALEPKLAISPRGHGQGKFTLPSDLDYLNRPIVGLDVDEITGDIYLVSSRDAGSEDSSNLINTDNGPYRSATFIIGNVNKAEGTVNIYPTPLRDQSRYHDGFKVETVARAQFIPADPFMTKFPATYIGTDDENYGGTLRKITI